MAGAGCLMLAQAYDHSGPSVGEVKAFQDALASDPDPVDILLRQLQRTKDKDIAQRHALHTSAGHVLRDQGRYTQAAEHYENALSLANDREQLIEAQQMLGLVEMHQGKLLAARHHLESAFVLTDQGDHLSLAVLRTLADVKREMGSLEEALKLYDHAWKIGLKKHDGDGLVLVAAEVSEAHTRRGEVDKALNWLKMANQQLDANKLDRGRRGDPAAIAKVDAYMAGVLHAQGHIKEAHELYKRALRAQAAALRPSHPDILATRMGMARAQRDSGDAEGALRAIEAVAKTLKSGPNEGPDLSRTLLLKADLLREAKRHKEAEDEIKLALKLQKQAFGGMDHPEVAVALSSYGSLLHDMGQYQEAFGKYKEALNLNLKTVGDRHPETASTYNSLGTLHEDAGNDEAAMTHFSKCLEIQLHTVGDKSPDVANSYNNLATVHFRRGSPEKAAELLRKAIAVLDAAGVPKGNPDRAVYEENLQEVLNPAPKSESKTEAAEPSPEPEEDDDSDDQDDDEDVWAEWEKSQKEKRISATERELFYPMQVHAF